MSATNVKINSIKLQNGKCWAADEDLIVIGL